MTGKLSMETPTDSGEDTTKDPGRNARAVLPWRRGADSMIPTREREALREAENLAAQLTQELSRLERRDKDFWLLVVLCGIVCGGTLLCLLFPSTLLEPGDIHLQITLSRHLFFVILMLLILLNTYIVARRAELRRARRTAVSTAIQSEFVHVQSFTDPLTEVYNRRSLDEMANRFICQARRSHEPLTFMMLDVDRFKEVNTRFGHMTGDFVLSEIAGLLRSSTRGSDAVVRYGGDEFLIVLANTSPQDAVVVVQRIGEYTARWNEKKYLEDFVLTVSAGMAGWSDGISLDEVLDAADKDMYTRKNAASHPFSGR